MEKEVATGQMKEIELLKDVLQIVGALSMRFEGYSMVPTIQPNTDLVVIPLHSAPLIGHVYVYYEHTENEISYRLVAHRLVRETSDGMVFKGDNRSLEDVPIQAAQIFGEVAIL